MCHDLVCNGQKFQKTTKIVTRLGKNMSRLLKIVIFVKFEVPEIMTRFGHHVPISYVERKALWT